MPTLKDARRIAQLLLAQDAIMEWLATLDGQEGYVNFGNIEECTKEDGSGGNGAYDGELVLPRDIAVRMLAREIEGIHGELLTLGITDSPESERVPEAAE